jgi:hypothetical protein
MKADCIYDETWEVPTSVEKTKEFMYNWENMKVYVPDCSTATFRDKTDEHFYFNGKGEEG